MGHTENELSTKPLTSFDFTHVLYDATSTTSEALAFLTLFPVLLNASYGALIIVTREFTIINMLIGQLLNEQFNHVVKELIREERPLETHGTGYGFPSSHSQWIGYFSTFLIFHIWTRHSFASHGSRVIDVIQQIVITSVLITFAGLVAYSRFYLSYHTPRQILVGLILGVGFGAGYYWITEWVPASQPSSPAGRLRTLILDSPILQWARVRDGWATYPDGGHEEAWLRWREAYQRLKTSKQRVSQKAKTR